MAVSDNNAKLLAPHMLLNKGEGEQTPAERIDINEVSRLTEAQARRNIEQGIALEKEFDPLTAQFRDVGMQGLLGAMGEESLVSPEARAKLQADIFAETPQLGVPELGGSEAWDLARQRILADFGLGGQLDRETANLVSRKSAETAGSGGFLGGGIGRDITARDLGLTSMQLRDQRLAQALGFGQAEMGLAERQQGLAANIAAQNAALKFQGQTARQGAAGFLSDLQSADFQKKFSVAQLGQSIPRPVAGLDPSDIANLTIADINAANQLATNNAALAQQRQQGQAQTAMGAAGVAVGAIALI